MKARIAAALFVFLLLNSGYLAAYPAASLFYMGNVVAHLGVGLPLMVAAVWSLKRYPREAGAFLAAGCVALPLLVIGNTLDHRFILWLHIALGVAAAAFVTLRFRRQLPIAVPACVVAVLLPVSAAVWSRVSSRPERPDSQSAIPPLSMDEEGLGAHSPFAPSSARTTTGRIIPSNFFMDSQTCGECHKDIYEQWKSSMHHMASFNNQFYRKSIEYMQSVNGTRGSKWCAGCHDHAVFFNGRFDRPISEQIDTPEAQAGLGCMSCHAIVHVGSTMGNSDFALDYPPLHELASSHSRPVRAIASFLTYLNPQPHRQTFMKPFMREAEFCAACHKVHLDVPVNNYRWFRGFDDYDNWQASGVSGQGARSFYYPDKSMACADCHMPLVASQRPGQSRRQGSLAPFRRGQYGGPVRRSGSKPVAGHREVSQIRLHHRGYLRGFAGGRCRGQTSMMRRSDDRAGQFHVRRRRRSRTIGAHDDSGGRQASRAGRLRRHAPGTRLHGPRGRGGANPQDRPFFSGRNGGCVRRLAGIAGHDADGRIAVLERQGGRRRQRPGRTGRAFLSLVPARRRGTPSTNAMPGSPAACSMCG